MNNLVQLCRAELDVHSCRAVFVCVNYDRKFASMPVGRQGRPTFY